MPSWTRQKPTTQRAVRIFVGIGRRVVLAVHGHPLARPHPVVIQITHRHGNAATGCIGQRPMREARWRNTVVVKIAICVTTNAAMTAARICGPRHLHGRLLPTSR